MNAPPLLALLVVAVIAVVIAANRARVARAGRKGEEDAPDAARPNVEPSSPAEARKQAADSAFNRGQAEEARLGYEEAARLYREQGDAAGEGRCLAQLGMLAFQRDQLDESLTHFERANALAENAGDPLLTATCNMSMGRLKRAKGDRALARRLMDQALAAYEAAGDKGGQADCLLELGMLTAEEGNSPDGRATVLRAIALYAETRNRLARTRAKTALAILMLRDGELRSGLEELELARDAFSSMDAFYDVLQCDLEAGAAVMGAQDYRSALKIFEGALPRSLKLNDTSAQIRCYSGIAHAADSLGDSERATEHCRKLLALSLAVGDIAGQADAHMTMGDVHSNNSQNAPALIEYAQAMGLYHQAGDRHHEAQCAASSGVLLRQDGDIPRSAEMFKCAIALFMEVDDLFSAGHCEFNLGDFAVQAGDPDAARTHYATSLARFERTDTPLFIGLTHVQLAEIARTDAERTAHVAAARAAYTRAERPDLLKELDEQFGPAPTA